MSKSNGPKQFLWVVKYTKPNGWDGDQFMIIADRDPTREELVALLKLDDRGNVEAQRYDLDAIPKLPPKGWGSV